MTFEWCVLLVGGKRGVQASPLFLYIMYSFILMWHTALLHCLRKSSYTQFILFSAFVNIVFQHCYFYLCWADIFFGGYIFYKVFHSGLLIVIFILLQLWEDLKVAGQDIIHLANNLSSLTEDSYEKLASASYLSLFEFSICLKIFP